jgi:hypothetical protein
MPGADGPLALPARWSVANARAAVSSEVLRLTGAVTPGPAALVVDYGRPGPASKAGVLVRGTTSIAAVEDGWHWLQLDGDRITAWEGVETETAPIV